MGCNQSKNQISANYQPQQKSILAKEEEEVLGDEVIDPENKNLGWPFEQKLATVNHQEIIEAGEPWTDQTFPPNNKSLFINGESHRDAQNDEKKKLWEEYKWERPDQFFKGEKFYLFKNIEPEDVKQGNIDNSHLMATLSGLAQQDMKVDKVGNQIKRIHDLLVVKKINKAGCYAVKLNIYGNTFTVVVDDYFPVKQDKIGESKLAFCKSKSRYNELWMLIVEKAIAKVFGSYEALEKEIQGSKEGELSLTTDFEATGDPQKDYKKEQEIGSKIGLYIDSSGFQIQEALSLLTGCPSFTYKVHDFLKDINRGHHRDERLDKLWKLIKEANEKNWTVVASTPSLPLKVAQFIEEKNRKWVTQDGKGIRYSHSYTILDIRKIEIQQQNKRVYTDGILHIRNPCGKDNRGEQWTGDWSNGCDLWTKQTKRQIEQSARQTTEFTFWMSLEDFIKYFKSFTINHVESTWSKRIIPADIKIEGDQQSEEYKDWGVLHLRTNTHSPVTFFEIYQLDRRFYEDKSKITQDYAELTMIIVKKARIPPKTEKDVSTIEYAYIQGVQGRRSQLSLKVDNIRNGDYYILYKAEFDNTHPCQKLNIVFHAPDELIKKTQINRLKPNSYRPNYFVNMIEQHKVRLKKGSHYEQPIV